MMNCVAQLLEFEFANRVRLIFQKGKHSILNLRYNYEEATSGTREGNRTHTLQLLASWMIQQDAARWHPQAVSQSRSYGGWLYDW